MFQYISPQFEKKHLLRVKMLEHLRDYPANFLKISFQEFKNGFIKGCRITWNDGVLSIEPGIVLYEGNLYCMDTSYQIQCLAKDKLRYLKIYFEKMEQREDGLYGDTKILLDEKETDSKCEIELCRFRLQEGAKLRCTYECFEDYSTQYDTVNILHVPFAAKGESTISPLILRGFANEMLKSGNEDTIDISFSINILTMDGFVPMDCLRAYLFIRTGEKPNRIEEIYKILLKILNRKGIGEHGMKQGKQDNRRVMLL